MTLLGLWGRPEGEQDPFKSSIDKVPIKTFDLILQTGTIFGMWPLMILLKSLKVSVNLINCQKCFEKAEK